MGGYVIATSRKRIPLWLLLSLCAAAITWSYVHLILIPWSGARDQQRNEIKAQMWDLYPRWLGARDLFIHGKNPYSSEVSHEIQTAFYGRPATPEEESRHLIDEQRFAYPIYVVFLMAPVIHTDFAQVEFWAPWVLGLFASLTVIFSMHLLDWQLPWSTMAALTLFTLSSPQIVQGMRHQQLSVVVACLITAAAWCVHRDHLITAGILLAWATIKPQMALLPCLWFALWAASEWRTRWRLLAGSAATMTILVGAGEFLVHGWIRDFFAATTAYRRYFPTSSILGAFLGDTLGLLVSLGVLIWLFIYSWKHRKAPGNSSGFSMAFAALLMATILTFPLFTPFNQAMLILPALLVVRDWSRLTMPARIASTAALVWPWIASLALLLFRPPMNPMSDVTLLPAVMAPGIPLLLPLLLISRRTQDEAQVGGLSPASPERTSGFR